MPTNTEKATFSGGCFWCMEPPFSDVEGVISVLPGYTGGHIQDPIYEQVITGKTGHVEAIQVQFNSGIVSYDVLLRIFWSQIDPTDNEGQFADKGDHYKTIIFYHSEVQRQIAEQSKKELELSGRFEKPIVTEIKKAEPFYVAETYHQQFYKKNPEYYNRYKVGSGRDSFIKKFWKRSSE
ncbi:peptide-methionine (S)-S-oxide reductase [bacterium]|nr:peptide-methionine (S)-S-oxide reductase [Actinomycetota bacterium]MBE33732.1 peptide-methionine (S)-S-oxide reductase [bacterium]|tara:strand:+ start:4555 stop:5094 length:540 start_codon:yes stop_codon:yes gene_type:complete